MSEISVTLDPIQRPVRISYNPEAKPFERLWIERAISSIYHRFIGMARKLKYVDEEV
ncbi:MAG: hypothetical protein WD768_05145 [Phycisphaeraceae bacterium]